MITARTIPGDTGSLAGSLSELLAKQVQQQADRTAVGTSDLRTVLTYRQLDRLVHLVMAQLSSSGVESGSTVALVSDNCIEFVLGMLAAVSLGARIAPLNPALTSSELTTRLSQLSAQALVIPRHLANKSGMARMPEDIPCWIIDLEETDTSSVVRIVGDKGQTSETGATDMSSRSVDPDGIALLMFTGGTTGPPKLVPLRHRNVMASVENICRTYAFSANDSTLLVMPLFHGHGLIAGLLATLASGGRAYVPSTGAFSAHSFWPDVVRLGVTWYTAVPTIHRILLNRASREYPASSPVPLRFIRSCSAPLDEELAAAIGSTFRVPLISAYGMTETSHQLSSNPLPIDGVNRMSSVGLPTGVEVRIANDNGDEVACGGIGEIWVRGETVTAGYLNNPEANSASFINGWFRSGDLGCKDREGYLFVKGRLKEMINRAGEKISPSDIDAVLLSHPKVLEAASFGEADPMYGENVQAAVVLRPGTSATENELRDFCRGHLSSFEVPERIYIVGDFPHTAKGSIDRHALAAQFAKSRGGVSR